MTIMRKRFAEMEYAARLMAAKRGNVAAALGNKTDDALPPLPAAVVCRRIGRLLCRARPQRAKARLRLFRTFDAKVATITK